MIGVLPILILIGVLVFALLRRRSGAGVAYAESVANHLHDGEALCGNCGYRVVPGSSTRCPECGHTHAEAGLLTPALIARFSASPLAVGLGTGIATFFFALIILSAARTTFYASNAGRQTAQTQRQAVYVPLPAHTTPVNKIDISLDGVTRDDPQGRRVFIRGTLVVRLATATGSQQMEYDIVPAAWSVTAPAGGTRYSGSGLDQGVQILYRVAGLDPAAPGEAAAAADLVQVLRRELDQSLTGNSTHWRSPGGTSSSQSNDTGAITPFIALAPAVVVGLWRAARQRSRLRRLIGGMRRQLPAI